MLPLHPPNRDNVKYQLQCPVFFYVLAFIYKHFITIIIIAVVVVVVVVVDDVVSGGWRTKHNVNHSSD